MKHILRFAFISLSILLFQSVGYGQYDWMTFKADAVLSFSVDVPAEMEFETKEITTAIGKLTTQTYSLEGKEDDLNYLYLINIVEYPLGTFPQDSIDLIDEYLLSSINSTVVKVKGKLVYTSDIDENKNGIGKLFRIKHNGDHLIIKGKSFIRKDAYISIQVFTLRENSLNDEMNYFLDSFKSTF